MATKDKASNMQLWNSVCTTDPQYTQKVEYGKRKFTAIGAQYQLMEATKVFGPFGSGFGVSDEKFTEFGTECLALYQARLWYYLDGKTDVIHQLPIHSSIKYSVNGRVDDDFAKKIATDALTKGLSKLGFNADVFLGLFDDNKYVNQLKAKSNTGNGSMTITDEMKAKIIGELNKCSDKAFITKVNTAVENGKINTNNFDESLTKLTKYVKANALIDKIKEVDKQYGEKKQVANG